MSLALIALGSNLGPRRACLDSGVRRLGNVPQTRVVRASRWAPSAPEAPGDGGWYLNGTALVCTRLRPRALLLALQRIERDLGRRVRLRDRARPLDLDLVVFALLRTSRRELEVPHSRYAERAFVLDPAKQIAPRLWDPQRGARIADVARRLIQEAPCTS